ncbi:hypothetical protein L210DRAFT_3509230 [Boletus edulis BED1]|uniref:Uncharacterized protein n=1 Tax=Boletus edulis BED1 TaxID=1328754 RepID=A0AAD4BG06_BOLED|nr:hypothetical protein L210DRAFT_3509230 [Boletus edulis BED1]
MKHARRITTPLKIGDNAVAAASIQSAQLGLLRGLMFSIQRSGSYHAVHQKHQDQLVEAAAQVGRQPQIEVRVIEPSRMIGMEKASPEMTRGENESNVGFEGDSLAQGPKLQKAGMAADCEGKRKPAAVGLAPLIPLSEPPLRLTRDRQSGVPERCTSVRYCKQNAPKGFARNITGVPGSALPDAVSRSIAFTAGLLPKECLFLRRRAIGWPFHCMEPAAFVNYSSNSGPTILPGRTATPAYTGASRRSHGTSSSLDDVVGLTADYAHGGNPAHDPMARIY